MINLDEYLKNFEIKVEASFKNRVVFIGIQGSYGRKEANEKSDLDLVLILDELSYDDLVIYDKLLNSLPHRDKICGFISGMPELLCWDAADLFQFYYDTATIKGDISWMENKITKRDVRRTLHKAACDIYHMAVHNGIHRKDPNLLKDTYKNAIFALQAKVYLEKGEYIKRHKDLFKVVEGIDKEICFINENNIKQSFEMLIETIIKWSKEVIIKYK